VAVIDGDQRFVLSLRASGLGDLLTAVPALRAVRVAHPDARHVLATSPGLQELACMIGAIDVVVTAAVQVGSPPPMAPVDVAVNLHGCGPESHCMLAACDPERLVGFERHDLGITGPRWDPDDLDVAAPPGPLPRGVGGATVVHPGAGAPGRRWPIDRWIAVADAELRDGHRVVVTLGRGESALGQAIAAAVPQVVLVDCSGDLALLLRVVDSAEVVVVGDTGVAHAATAVRTPSVVLFGPEPPSRWGPPPQRPWHVALWAGRTGDPHSERTDPGLLELGVADVLLALRRVRERDGAVPGRREVAAVTS